jgi:hypothetical protein
MKGVSKDMGVVAVLAKRMVEERLPKALALKERIDRGGVLSDYDLRFLEQVLEDSNKIKPMVEKDPKALEVYGRMAELYREISAKALENEKAQKK